MVRLRGRRRTQALSCLFITLPNEVLLFIIQYLKVNAEFSFQLTRASAHDLASLARTCRRFYDLAMAPLWERVELWAVNEWPRDLSSYPRVGSKDALSFIRAIKLGVDVGIPIDRDGLQRMSSYIAGCLRLLKEATLLESVDLRLGLYDLDQCLPKSRSVVEEYNGTAIQMLHYINTLQLRNFTFTPAGSTAGICEIIPIIEQNVDTLYINSLDLDTWASFLKKFEKLSALEAFHTQSSTLQSVTAFWTTVAQLPNLKQVTANAMPIPPSLNLHFRHLVDLRIHLWWLDRVTQFAHSFIAVFTQMPSLEKLQLLAMRDDDYCHAANAMEIRTILCKNLKYMFLDSPIPPGFVSMIGLHCKNLTDCSFNEHVNIIDDDIRQLSRSCPNLRKVRLHQAEKIATLRYFTTFHQLDCLELHYKTAQYIDKSLLVSFVNSCPNLKEIIVSDWDASIMRCIRPRPFEETPRETLFSAAADLLCYFEPTISKGLQWQPGGLDNYRVRLDRIRDILQFQQLTQRVGAGLGLDLLSEQAHKPR